MRWNPCHQVRAPILISKLGEYIGPQIRLFDFDPSAVASRTKAASVPGPFARRRIMPRLTGRLAWRLMVIATAIWAASAAWAQGDWVKLARFPDPAEEISGAAAGGKIYPFAGPAPGREPLGLV